MRLIYMSCKTALMNAAEKDQMEIRYAIDDAHGGILSYGIVYPDMFANEIAKILSGM
jgi:hypothetical protein